MVDIDDPFIEAIASEGKAADPEPQKPPVQVVIVSRSGGRIMLIGLALMLLSIPMACLGVGIITFIAGLVLVVIGACIS